MRPARRFAFLLGHEGFRQRPVARSRRLREHGYRFFQLDAGRRIVETTTMPAGGNVVSVHRSSAAFARGRSERDTIEPSYAAR